MIALTDYILGIDGKHEEDVLEAAVELGTRTKKWLEDHGFKVAEADLAEMIKATHSECDRRTGEQIYNWDWYLNLKNGNVLVAKVYKKNVEHFSQWRQNEKSYTIAKRYGADGYAKTPKEMDEIWDKFIKKLV